MTQSDIEIGEECVMKWGKKIMKARRETIVNQNRVDLGEVLPLKNPYKIVLDPCNLCNFKCKFCAMQTSDSPVTYKKQIMEWDLYKKIIKDICQFEGRLKLLFLTGQGEPLLNKRFCDMVRYAKEANCAERIETITNGSCLNDKLNSELAECGLDRIRISVEAIDEQGYVEIAEAKIDMDKFIANILDLYNKTRGKTEIYIKTVDAAVDTEEKKKLFYSQFDNICDQICIDQVIPLWSDFKEMEGRFNLKYQKGMHGQEIKNVRTCPYAFYSFLINPDGDITACCADWKRKFIFGNAKSQSVREIWESERYKNFLIDMLKGKKNDYEMCQSCLLPMFDCNDNIDEDVDRILDRIQRNQYT